MSDTRPSQPSIENRLLSEGHHFDFFQAVRLLEAIASERDAGNPEVDADSRRRSSFVPVGQDGPSEREAVRFSAVASLAFPSGSIASIEDSDLGVPRMSVAFMGLTGPSGALPHHYTSLLIDQVRQKELGLRDFFDLFNHRLISLFYRAWQKYRFPTAYERSKRSAREESQVSKAWENADDFTSVLLCLAGFGTAGQQGRAAFHDEAAAYYSGHFAHQPRSAIGLELVLGDYFGVPTSVCQFMGQWLPLAEEDRSRLPSMGVKDRESMHCRLGQSVVLGKRVWDVQSRFRIRLGPLTYAQYCVFMPGEHGLKQLLDLTRAYVGVEFDFDVQPVLKAGEVPSLRLGASGGATPGRLGRNTWMISRPMTRDFEDAIFSDGAA